MGLDRHEGPVEIVAFSKCKGPANTKWEWTQLTHVKGRSMLIMEISKWEWTQLTNAKGQPTLNGNGHTKNNLKNGRAGLY